MDVILHELPLVLVTMISVEYVGEFAHRHHFGTALDQFTKFVTHLLAQIPFLILPLLKTVITNLSLAGAWL